jgi:hypothetical protein
MNDGAGSYNVAAIRQLLLAAFDPKTLHRFCQDRPAFRPILDEFSPEHGLSDRVGKVIDYCEAHDLFEQLLAEIEATNPDQYRRFEPQLRTAEAPAAPPVGRREPAPARPLLRDRRLWVAAVVVVLAAVVVVAASLYRRPTAYMALILDNGPGAAPHQLDELKEVLQAELSRSLPDAALALRVFGGACGQTQRLVDFSRGNAARVAEALGGVQPVAQADLTEAIRQGLNDLLSTRGEQPRVLVAVTWGVEGCGGDLDETLASYRRQLGSTVQIELLSLGGMPAMAGRPGLNVQEVSSVTQAGAELSRILDALAAGSWPPVRPAQPATPTATQEPTPTPTGTATLAQPLPETPAPTETATPTRLPAETAAPTATSTLPPVFLEDFQGQELDGERWQAYANAGRVGVEEGWLYLETSGDAAGDRSFPYVQAREPLFPPGGWQLDAGLEFTAIGACGTGLVIAEGRSGAPPLAPADWAPSVVVMLWADASEGLVLKSPRDADRSQWQQQVLAPPGAGGSISCQLTLSHAAGRYRVEIAIAGQEPVIWEPALPAVQADTLWMGNPEALDQPCQWTSMRVDRIRVDRLP